MRCSLAVAWRRTKQLDEECKVVGANSTREFRQRTKQLDEECKAPRTMRCLIPAAKRNKQMRNARSGQLFGLQLNETTR